MEFEAGQVVGGLIGLGLVIKGLAEWAVKRNGPNHQQPTCAKCNLSATFEEECERHRQEVMLALREIVTILRERK